MIKNINDTTFVDTLVSVIPSPRQLEWQKLEYYNFVHYGMNTYTNKEWGNGKTDPMVFNPTHDIDTDQWVKTFKDSGSKGVILTAKHHDGFCLYPSQFTDYTIASSGYQGGKGDLMLALSKSCEKYDFKLGVYLSPWDMHEESYGTPEYNDFFCNQLRELLTNYGKLFAVWFDGACGEGPNGKKQVYDFTRYYDLIRELQPDAVITICGPDVRWIGNEGGRARKSEWSVVSSKLSDYESINAISQQVDDTSFMNDVKETSDDIGSRAVLSKAKGLIWYPAEMDVSITKHGWFHHKFNEVMKCRSVNDLCSLYYNSVGNNSSLLLNVPANKDGIIPHKFAKILTKFGNRIKEEFSNPISADISYVSEASGYFYYEINCPFATVSKIVIQEDITCSQRVEKFALEIAGVNDYYTKLYEGTTIGYKKICVMRPTNMTKIRLKITQCRNNPVILDIKLYR